MKKIYILINNGEILDNCLAENSTEAMQIFKDKGWGEGEAISRDDFMYN